MQKIGITERGDAALDLSWYPWVESGKPAILITKDPWILKDHIWNKNYNIIVHCTITGHGDTAIEPNVRCYEESLIAFYDLRKRYGSDRIVLRVDPIIPTATGYDTAEAVIKEAQMIAGPHFRLRISFLDNYKHVRERFKQAGLEPLELSTDPNALHAPLELRRHIATFIGQNHESDVEICGEPGMNCTGCISKLDCDVLGVEPVASTSQQRKACACLSQKHELLKTRGQCKHGCLYCYWK